MTIDEAIEHAKKVARTCYDGQCAADHMQLAEWLRQARGAGKAARWYTAKIRELENRSKALETLSGEKEAENERLRELVRHLYEYREMYFRTGIYPTDHGVTEHRMRELGIEVEYDKD